MDIIQALFVLLVVVVTIIGANPIDDDDSSVSIGKEQHVFDSLMESRSNAGIR